jgi:MFS family permease
MKKFLKLFIIIMAGETIFMLPFLIPRLYRPLMLNAWGITNTDIGTAFSAYGLSAMISYFIGGPLADKYRPQKLISISLLATALGATFLIYFPSKSTLIAVYFYFGISTILLMWGALIKVTHELGGESQRASAMGLLDSGRGLVAALVSSILIYFISSKFNNAQLSQHPMHAMRTIITMVGLFTLIIAIAVWFILKNFEISDKIPVASSEDEVIKKDQKKWSIEKSKIVLSNYKVWLLGIIVLSSYCGYKSVDNYSIYLVDIHGISISEASRLTSILFWVRPISALLAGFSADYFAKKVHNSRFIILFILLFLGSITQLLLALNIFGQFSLVFTTIIFSASMVYALRAIYFAVLGDLHIPENLIGTTVGIVSLVGYLPDMFFGAFTGYLIDNFKGIVGYQYVFGITAIFLLIGSLASLVNLKKASKVIK